MVKPVQHYLVMEDDGETEARMGSAMSIHLALINQEASQQKARDDHNPRKSGSKQRLRKGNKIKLPKLPKKVERDLFTQPTLLKRNQVQCLELLVANQGSKLHHCSEHLLEESIKESYLKKDLKVLTLQGLPY